MKLFTNAKWIWNNAPAKNDEYVDFAVTVDAVKDKQYTLTLASDSNYALYINGDLAEFGQFADYPHHTVADVLDITKHLKEGENKLSFIVWYYGADTQTYIHGEAGFIFEITENGTPIIWSSNNTLSRYSKGYVPHEEKMISGQLGYTYHFDAKQYDGFWETGIGDGFAPSREAEGISYDFSPRPVKNLVLEDRLDPRICQEGYFTYQDENADAHIKMQDAFISNEHFGSLYNKMSNFSDGFVLGNSGEISDKGVYFIIDLGSENVGFLDLDIELPYDCTIDIGYGEHLDDGRCRTAIRNFSAVYDGKQGRNKFLNQFRRFGCRYLQFFIHANTAKVYYAGLCPTTYPVNIKKYESGNVLRDTIYSVCQNTLLQCMHEHYEDCPWREQALYCMDSRNQMLCGYYAFNEYQFPRASLELMTYGVMPSGLLSICYPCGNDLLIPSFSAVFFIQMYEYIKYSGDKSLAEEKYDVLTSLIERFIKQIDDTGVLINFTENGSWNFYEWSDDLAGRIGGYQEPYHEACLSAFASLALKNMAMISEALGKRDDTARYSGIAEKLNKNITEAFYNKDVGLFENRIETQNGNYSVLTNSLCLLCGAADEVDKTRIFEILKTNGKADVGVHVTPNTLSMNCFRFDALIAADREAYKDVILRELDTDYLYMLRNGATAFWETIDGADAFGQAGSLCHGWSALPIYYYEVLGE